VTEIAGNNHGVDCHDEVRCCSVRLASIIS
jgi:hypothetical protein